MNPRLILAAAVLALTGVACGASPDYADTSSDSTVTTTALERNNAEGRSARASARFACDEAYDRLPGDTDARSYAGAYADSFARRVGRPFLRGAAYQGCLEGLGGL